MLLFPRKVKHRKWQTGRRNPNKVRIATRGITVAFGAYALRAQSTGRIRSNQIEAARKTLVRTITKTGKVWIRVFTDRPVTQKAAEVGMGKGKGDPVGYCLEILPGRVLFEVDGVTEAVAREALRKAGAKLPIKTRIVSRV
jgi:large subunit ribosomal protein L16